ncbi:unnamed protein product, partial [Ixodes pacificus]
MLSKQAAGCCNHRSNMSKQASFEEIHFPQHNNKLTTRASTNEPKPPPEALPEKRNRGKSEINARFAGNFSAPAVLIVRKQTTPAAAATPPSTTHLRNFSPLRRSSSRRNTGASLRFFFRRENNRSLHIRDPPLATAQCSHSTPRHTHTHARSRKHNTVVYITAGEASQKALRAASSQNTAGAASQAGFRRRCPRPPRRRRQGC